MKYIIIFNAEYKIRENLPLTSQKLKNILQHHLVYDTIVTLLCMKRGLRKNVKGFKFRKHIRGHIQRFTKTGNKEIENREIPICNANGHF